MEISKQLLGVTGEYYVAAEISRRGYLAAITLRNSDSVDMLVSNINGDKLFSIQVKTTLGKGKKWLLNKKVEHCFSEKMFFVFVFIPENLNISPEYIIVKASVLGKRISEHHHNWLSKPKKDGQPRKDSPMRKFDPHFFASEDRLTWDQLLEIINGD